MVMRRKRRKSTKINHGSKNLVLEPLRLSSLSLSLSSLSLIFQFSLSLSLSHSFLKS
jgi:hypothetical protein